jgi:cyclic pyranopterin phosphate synthase
MDCRLIITNKCNYSCWFCHKESWDSASKNNMALDDIEKLVPLLKLFGVEKFTISGGEPTLHPFIDKIIDILYKNRVHISMVTNGSLYEKNLHIFNHINLINYSIHTLDPNQYFINSNNKITLDKAIINFNILKNNFPENDIRLNIIIDEYFINNIEKCISIINNIKFVKLLELFPLKNEYLSIDNIAKKLENMGYVYDSNLIERRKRIYKKNEQKIFLTRVICAEKSINNLNTEFCKNNAELNISPDLVIKKCRMGKATNIKNHLDNEYLFMEEISSILKMDNIICGV